MVTPAIFQHMASGILLGSVLALSAVGFSLIFGVLDIVDLSHGAQVILGSYIALFLWREVNLDPVLSIPIVAAVVFVLGFLFQRQVLERVNVSGEAQTFAVLLITFGAHLIVSDFVNFVFSPDFQSISPWYAGSALQVAGLYLSYAQFLGLVLALVFLGLLYWLLYLTRLGRQIRAVAQNPDVAELCGIDTAFTYAFTFGLGAALSAATGPIVAVTSSFNPTSMITYTIFALVIVVIGGLNRIFGVIVGGLVVGLVTTFTAAYASRALVDLVLFLVFIGVLLIRPQGLLGSTDSEVTG